MVSHWQEGFTDYVVHPIMGRLVAKGGRTPALNSSAPPARVGDYPVAIPPNRSIERSFTKNEAFYGLFCGLQICQNCFGGLDSAPHPTGEAHDAPPDLLLTGGQKRGRQMSCPQPWIKKIKTQLPRYAYKRAGSHCH